MTYSPWSSSPKKGKGKGKGKGKKGVCWNCGESDHYSRDSPNANKTTAAQMVVRGRIRKAARQTKMQAKDGMQARAIGTPGETVRANTKTGKVVVSPKYGKVRTNRMIGARQRGKARAVRKAAAKAALTELTKLRKIHFVRYIRKKVQREGRHKENLRMSKESTVKEEESTHTTDIKHSTFWSPSERRTRQRKPMHVFDKSDKGKRIREEAVVDSGAVKCV